MQFKTLVLGLRQWMDNISSTAVLVSSERVPQGVVAKQQEGMEYSSEKEATLFCENKQRAHKKEE